MFKDITLEMSLKPFKQTDKPYIRSICAQIFEQWRALLKNRKSISIMLWAGDGSEILDYAGKQEETFEWARFVGTANLPHLEDSAPLETSLHKRKQDYKKCSCHDIRNPKNDRFFFEGRRPKSLSEYRNTDRRNL